MLQVVIYCGGEMAGVVQKLFAHENYLFFGVDLILYA
jgi:hypothetical protein